MKIRAAVGAVILCVLSCPAAVLAQSAKIIDVRGQALVKKEAVAQWQKARVNMMLGGEAEIQTKKKAQCTLAFDEELKNILTVKEDSHIKIENVRPGRVFLPEGRVFSLINNIAKAQTFEVRTPTAIAGARGTGWLTEHKDGSSLVECFDDTVFVEGQDSSGQSTGEKDLPSGFGMNIPEGGALGDPFDIGDEDRKQWKQFSKEAQDLVGEEGAGEDTGDDEGQNEDALNDLEFERDQNFSDSTDEYCPPDSGQEGEIGYDGPRA